MEQNNVQVVENVAETTEQEKKGFVNKLKSAFKKGKPSSESMKKIIVGTTGLVAVTMGVITVIAYLAGADATETIENVSEELINAEE